VLDVGGGAGHQSFPLAQAGYDVTLLDLSPTMLDRARQRLERLPAEAQRRVKLVQADGENADEARTVDASLPCCVTACSDTSGSRSRWSTSCAGVLRPAA
jgi:protein-L-isoaspartate O-methyltransferase